MYSKPDTYGLVYTLECLCYTLSRQFLNRSCFHSDRPTYILAYYQQALLELDRWLISLIRIDMRGSRVSLLEDFKGRVFIEKELANTQLSLAQLC